VLWPGQSVDKLVTTAQERFWNCEAFARDCWIKDQAKTLAAGSRVLDAGAGASKYRPFFAHCRYETQDFCQYQGPLVKYLQPIDYVCEITAIPLPDASLDAIVCTEVIEHVVDPVAVLAEFSRLLKPGGKLFLTAPLMSSLHMVPYHYYGGFTHLWYHHWLPEKGFNVESITAVSGPGRVCVYFCQAFYSACAVAEQRARPLWRWTSRLLRAGAKPFVHYLLPWLLPRFDAFVGNEVICFGYMVAATRAHAKS
jgi:SAM-dependent methyltransferase